MHEKFMKPVDETNPGIRHLSVEILIFSMIGISAVLAMISYRYHLAAVAYGSFIEDEVFARTRIRGRMENAIGRPIRLDSETIERQSSPYYPKYGYPPSSLIRQAQETRTNLEKTPTNLEKKYSIVGSDYFAVWHYNREWLRGQNPYRNPGDVVYRDDLPETKGEQPTVIVDHGVPHQPVTELRYFPLSLLVVLPFYVSNYFASLFLFLAVFHVALFSLAAWLIRLSRGYRFQATVLMIVLYLASYPIGFMVDRGNIEGAIFLWVAAGLILLRRGNYYSAAICLGLAAGTKLTPALYFALFLLDGRIKPFLVAVIVMVGATALAMAFMHDPILTIFEQMRQHISNPGTENQAGTMTTRFNHSLLNFVRTIPALVLDEAGSRRWTGLLYRYWPYGVLLSTFAILFRLRHLPFANRSFVLTCMMLSFPFASYDYRLILLYIPLGFIYLDVIRAGRADWPNAAICLLSMLLFAPKAYEFWGLGIDFAVNGMTLAVLIVLGLLSPAQSGPTTDRALIA